MCWKTIADTAIWPHTANLSSESAASTDQPGGSAIAAEINARLWVLNLSDGEHSLLDIAERSGLPFVVMRDAARLLFKNNLLGLPPQQGDDLEE